MVIELNLMELVALQKVARYPGSRVSLNMDEMLTYGMVQKFEHGYKITDGGRIVLMRHEPFLCTGQNMAKPLGYKPY